MPTLNHRNDEIEKMYEQIDEVIKLSRGNDNLVVIGDWNAVVEETIEQGVTGAFGLRRRDHHND